MSLGNTWMLVSLDKNTKERDKKKISKTDYNGKIEQNIFACCFVLRARCSRTLHTASEMQVAKSIFFPSQP